MSGEWSPWIEHDGSGYPAPVGTAVVIHCLRFGDYAGCIGGNSGRSWFWRMGTDGIPRCINPTSDPVLRYRLRRPPAVQLLVDIAETLPVREMEDA